jgi:hypothetical protein
VKYWLIEKAGVTITVGTACEECDHLVRDSLSALLPVQVEQPQGELIKLDYQADFWMLDDDQSDVHLRLLQTGDAIYHLTDRIVFHIANSSQVAHCLHAAAVSHKQRALIIPGDSGHGKSSLTAWLVANGFEYITDELVLIDDDNKLEGVGRPIQIKASGVDAVSSLIKDESKVFPGSLANGLTVDVLGGQFSQSEALLSLILFVKFEHNAGFSLEKLSSAQAGLKLMGSHVNARNMDGYGFNQMTSLARNTQCYSLVYGGFDTLPEDFVQTLQSLLLATTE